MAKVSDINFKSVHSAVGGPVTKVKGVLKAIQAERIANVRFRNRIKNAKTSEDLREEFVLYEALTKEWTVGKSKFQFFELQEFSKGKDEKPLHWDKHEGSIPEKLLGVRWQEKEGELWVTLPINVGFSTKSEPTERVGQGKFLDENPFLTKAGKLPRVAVISGYVEDHKDPVISDNKTGLKRKDIRGRVENALMQMLCTTGIDTMQSSILTNVRNDPINGVMLAITGLYKAYPHIILPFNKQVNLTLRERIMLQHNEITKLSEKLAKKQENLDKLLKDPSTPQGTIARKQKALGKMHNVIAKKMLNVARPNQELDGPKKNQNNGACWISYFNPETMDTSRIPKIDLVQAFASTEIRKEYTNPTPEKLKEYFKRLTSIMDAAYGIAPVLQSVLEGYSEFVPKEAFTTKALTDRDYTGIGTFTTPSPRIGTKEPPKEYDKSTVGWTILHHMAVSDQLKHLPLAAFTPQTLTVRDNDGMTPMHCAAAEGQLQDIPKNQLTKRNLTIRDWEGWTPVHSAAANGHLNQIPSELLTTAVLTGKDVFGWSPIHAAAAHGHLNQIPEAILKKALLTEQTFDGHTPLQVAANTNQLDSLLGIELPEAARAIVGEKWWENNLHKINEHAPEIQDQESLAL